MNRRLTQYNNMVYESGPIKFIDYINNNPNKIHTKLYEDALSKFIEHYCISQLIYNSLIYVKSDEYDDIFALLSDNLYADITSTSTPIINVDPNVTPIPKTTSTIIPYTTSTPQIISTQLPTLSFSDKAADKFIHKFNIQNLGYVENNDGTITNVIPDENLINILKNNANIKIFYSKFSENDLVYKTIQKHDKETGLEIFKHYVMFPNYNPPIINYIKDTTFDYNTFINDAKENFRKNVYIIEKYGDEYWEPASIIIFHNMGKMLDYYESNYLHICKQEVSLETWWNHTQDKNKYKPQDVKVVRERLSNPQVKYLNYISGKAIMNDKSEPNLDFNIDFDILNEKTNISDEYLLKELFRTKLKNNN